MNNDDQFKNPKRVAKVIVALVVVFLTFTILRNTFTFYITGTSPKNDSNTPSITKRFTITFNKPLDPNQDFRKTVKDDPENTWTKFSIDGRKLTVEMTSLEIGKSYSFYFPEIYSTNGKVIKDFSYSFKAEYVRYDRMSKEEQELAMEGVDENNFEDPVLDVTPYSTLDYTITPEISQDDEGDDFVTIRIEVNLSNSDRGSEKTAIKTRRTAALAYLKSKGIDIKKYPIIYNEHSSIIAPAN